MFHIFGQRFTSGDHPVLPADASRAFAAIARGVHAERPTGSDAQARRTRSLIASGAWTDAALSLIGIDQPAWQLRRLELDGGEWLCTLSRTPQMPSEIDDAVDGRDPLLPLAILEAVLEAHRRSTPNAQQGAQPGDIVHTVPVWSDEVSR